ncbi:mycofactocin-coupled SDR family oxidoreductase [Mycolicibacterium holsaticum]|jgi:SDR family mycofactocin-dependent oxidoreductase|uniref:3-oxoacyl-[acyl-carrier-protein] reductase n=1 Tax=Mycolicibacterium holsaticum TaxID=152142 RepID=A0A1E3S0K6_9MYCO|nr:mycofactocin-coupled SDR family oxidoreductase [Mycolicibacterium holsaticum]MDA4109654.1 NAD-dependent oxidoreductase [Mycolicibacterium holsaticum DSM 44478 = JCM 12374]ODQ95624.1 3-oxoacyl-[acyl-carrier-protein] reductase [Mycolicibacterium holsaticum]QZA10589.1 mycofactocin-coupled SDR family oxidoreductase [Mycolicibacterium holsaticum DSM 44478 = JCM 12374]UNC11907.1 mycofactocin-coupled SDR family oxidoreductase [Mycolicibacterium holsaticum DSM 44478 = JCM 12374]
MTNPDAPLAGKVAYVTGAARGQGRAHCVRLARAGADIVAIDACGPVAEHNGYPPALPEDLAETVSLVEGEGRKIVADRVDVRDAAGQQRVVSDAVEQFGRLDIVVANAGVMNWGRLWEISAQQWQDVLDVNLTGVWNTIKAVVPPMIAAGNGGSIITISSAAGIKAVPGCGHYCASKFGLVGLTNSLAVELGEYGIRVNSVHPYGTDTPMGNDTSMWQIFADHQTYIHSFSPGALPTDSLADPDLISDIVLWLASDASALVTAAQIPADKGYLKI